MEFPKCDCCFSINFQIKSLVLEVLPSELWTRSKSTSSQSRLRLSKKIWLLQCDEVLLFVPLACNRWHWHLHLILHTHLASLRTNRGEFTTAGEYLLLVLDRNSWAPRSLNEPTIMSLSSWLLISLIRSSMQGSASSFSLSLRYSSMARQALARSRSRSRFFFLRSVLDL